MPRRTRRSSRPCSWRPPSPCRACGAPAPAAQSDQDLVNLACGPARVPGAHVERMASGPRRAALLHPARAQLRRLRPAARGAVGLHPGRADALVRARASRPQGEVGGPSPSRTSRPRGRSSWTSTASRPPTAPPMNEAVQPATRQPPKLVVTLVWDCGRHRTCLQWPDAQWPYLGSLIREGHVVQGRQRRVVADSTAQDHATIGTGAFPNHHGIVGHHFQLGGQDHDARGPRARRSSSSRRSPTSTTGRWTTSRSSGWSAPSTSTSGCWVTARSSPGATATSR